MREGYRSGRERKGIHFGNNRNCSAENGYAARFDLE